MKSSRALLGLVLVAGLGYFAWSANQKKVEQPASVAVAKVVDPQAKSVLEKASVATENARVVRYDALYSEKHNAKKCEGRVSADLDQKLFGIRDGHDTRSETVSTRFELTSDGSHGFLVTHKDKSFVHGEMSMAQGMLRVGAEVVMQEFGTKEPFKSELASGLEYEGKTDVNGVMCDVVYVKYDKPGRHARWYFGDDGLPRKVDRLLNMYPGIPDEQKLARTLALSNLEVNPVLAMADYRLTLPEGYEDKELLPPEPALADGTRAPDWALKDSNGGTLSLASMRGSVVVLDFWATWCGPCVMAMPGLQKLYEDYSGKPVRIVGINTADTHDDPGGFMRDRGYTYDIGLDGDAVANAYHVSGYPTFYVLDQKGQVAYSGSGFSKESEEELAKVVAGLLAQGELADAESGS